MPSDTSVRESGRSERSWREALEAAQYDYEQAKRERRRLARTAALAGFTKRQIAECMGITASMVQKLTGITGTTRPDLDETVSWSGGSSDVIATLNGDGDE